jgi:hypothetical protein
MTANNDERALRDKLADAARATAEIKHPPRKIDQRGVRTGSTDNGGRPGVAAT